MEAINLAGTETVTPKHCHIGSIPQVGQQLHWVTGSVYPLNSDSAAAALASEIALA